MPASQEKGVHPKKLKGVPMAAAVPFGVLLILWARVFYGSMQDYKTGDAFPREDLTIRAITYFERSLHCYAPINPYVERSAKRP
jgi:hypothetical protein